MGVEKRRENADRKEQKAAFYFDPLWDSDCARFFALTTSAKPHAPVHIASADTKTRTSCRTESSEAALQSETVIAAEKAVKVTIVHWIIEGPCP